MRKMIVLLVVVLNVGSAAAAAAGPKWPLMRAAVVNKGHVWVVMPRQVEDEAAGREACRQASLDLMCGDIPGWRCKLLSLFVDTVHKGKGYRDLGSISCFSSLK